MSDISLIEPIRTALRSRTWKITNGHITAVGADDHLCEVVEAENDGPMYGLSTSREQAMVGLVYAVVCAAKERGTTKLTISPMRLHPARGSFCVNVTFE